MSRYLVIAFSVAFFILAVSIFMKGQPEDRNKRVYTLIKPHIPYTLEKKMSGLRIRNTITNEKIEPSNAEIYNVLDNLEKEWGKTHLRLQGNLLTVLGDDNKTRATITLENDRERTYVRSFFGLTPQ